MTIPAVLSDMIAELPGRVERLEAGLRGAPESFVDIAHDIEFVQDVAAIASLFCGDEVQGLRPELLQKLSDLANQRTASGQTEPEPGARGWLSRYADQAHMPEMPPEYLQFLQETGFDHDGFRISLAEFWVLQTEAPDAVTPALLADFEGAGDHILDALVTCLIDVFSQNDALFHQVMGTPLQLTERQVDHLLSIELPSAQISGSNPVVFETAAEMLEASKAQLVKSNISGGMCRAIFDAGHVIIGPPGPNFSFTVHPDKQKAPLLYVPFTGHARDVMLLCHQMGHAVHLWLAALNSTFPVKLSPSVDEIIPSYFEQHAFTILEKRSCFAAAEARKEQLLGWHSVVRQFQNHAKVVQSARHNNLTRKTLENSTRNLLELVCGRSLFPSINMTSSAWGHLVAESLRKASIDERLVLSLRADHSPPCI